MTRDFTKWGAHGNTGYLLTILISVGVLLFGVFFVLYAGNLSQEETSEYVQQATLQSQVAVNAHIAEELETVETAMILKRERPFLANDAAFERMLERLLGSSTYLRAGIADTDGQAMWADQNGKIYRQDLSGEPFIREALGGGNAVSESSWHVEGETGMTDYAVPMFDEDGVVQGVIFASEPESELRKVVENSLFAGRGLAHIITSGGDYVVESNSPLSLAVASSVFEIGTPVPESVEKKMRADFAAGRAGHIEEAFYGENRLIAYAPLAYNDWYVFYAVPEDMVNAGMKTVIHGAVGVLLGAGCIFVLFILLLRWQNDKNRRRLEELAFVDPVTGRRNLLKFSEDAKRMLRERPGQKYAICCLDVKGFKYINALFGRGMGNRLLRYISDVAAEMEHPGEVNGRAQADLFVVLTRYESNGECERRFEEFVRKVREFPGVVSREYKLELYAGVYCVDKADGALTLEDMLDRAGEAQKHEKQKGNGTRIGFYSREMRAQKLWETEVESKMEKALSGGEFKVHFQPKIGIQGEVHPVGMEALVRWEQPGKGLIPPAQFIDLFERNGFIVNLDRYVFEQACQSFDKGWFEKTRLVLSVNVSRLALVQTDFVQEYAAVKEQYGIPDGCLEIEFTERTALEDVKLFRSVVDQLHGRGFLCSLDDFGSGYSSLNVLKSLRVDVLKLDKLLFDFGDDAERGRELVRNVVSMAKSLRLKTVAEGIDNTEDVRWLREIGCDVVQGYVFSKPLVLEDFVRFVNGWGKG